MNRLLKVELFLIGKATRAIFLMATAFFQPALKTLARTYCTYFVLALIVVAASYLYAPSVSQNDRTFAGLIVLLSFMATMKATIVVSRLAIRWGQKRYGTQPAQLVSSEIHTGIAIFFSVCLLVSLVPPIVVFRFQNIAWAEQICVTGLMYLAIALAALVVLFASLSSFRKVAGRVFSVLRPLPLFDPPTVAGQMFQEAALSKPRQ
jgi:hypothetical protein